MTTLRKLSLKHQTAEIHTITHQLKQFIKKHPAFQPALSTLYTSLKKKTLAEYQRLSCIMRQDPKNFTQLAACTALLKKITSRNNNENPFIKHICELIKIRSAHLYQVNCNALYQSESKEDPFTAVHSAYKKIFELIFSEYIEHYARLEVTYEKNSSDYKKWLEEQLLEVIPSTAKDPAICSPDDNIFHYLGPKFKKLLAIKKDMVILQLSTASDSPHTDYLYALKNILIRSGILFLNEGKPSLTEIHLYDAPPAVNPLDLQLNKKLLSDSEIARLKAFFNEEKLEDGRHSKNCLDYLSVKDQKANKKKYSIIKNEQEYFAIYKGKKWKKLLGTGAGGTVKLAQNLQSGEWVALKVQDISKDLLCSIERKEDEVHTLGMLGKIKAPLVVRDTKYNTLMEYAPGIELHAFLEKQHEQIRNHPNRRIPMSFLLNVVVNILKEVKNLLDNQILHRDLKPENILIELFTGKVHLVDFGFARHTLTKTISEENLCGTPDFIAPELVIQFRQRKTALIYSEKTEIFALGIIIARILGIHKATYPKRFHSLYVSVLNCRGPHPVWAYSSEFTNMPELLEHLLKMTSSRPTERPTLEETLHFFQTLQNKIKAEYPEKIGIIDIEEFGTSSILQQLQFIHALQCIDKIIFISSPTVDRSRPLKSLYTSWISQLKNHLFLIKDSVYFGPQREALLNTLCQHLIPQAAEEKSEPASQLYYFTSAASYPTLPGIQTIKIEEGKNSIDYRNLMTPPTPSEDKSTPSLPSRVSTTGMFASSALTTSPSATQLPTEPLFRQNTNARP